MTRVDWLEVRADGWFLASLILMHTDDWFGGGIAMGFGIFMAWRAARLPWKGPV